MDIGFHTGSLQLHDLRSAMRLVLEPPAGFTAVGVRFHRAHLNPLDDSTYRQQVDALLTTIGKFPSASIVVDTEGYYLCDHRIGRAPSMDAADSSIRQQRTTMVEDGLELAARIRDIGVRATTVTFSTGKTERSIDDDDDPSHTAGSLDRLANQLQRLLDRAKSFEVPIALRPLRGDSIASISQFERLLQWIPDPYLAWLLTPSP